MKKVNVFWFSFFAYVLIYACISFVTLLPVLSPSMNNDSKIETSDKKEFKSKKQTLNNNEGKTTFLTEPMS